MAGQLYEAKIVIEDCICSISESATIRVALESFSSELLKPGCLGTDEHGEAMRCAYLKNIHSLREKLFRP